MNSVGQSGDKKSYRVVLLLVVGLTAFSSAMKELNELRQFTRDANNLVASWSSVMAPAPVAAPEVVVPAHVPPVVAKVETCERTLSASIEHMGGVVAQEEVKIKDVGIKDVGKTVVVERTRRRDSQVALLRSHRSADIEMIELRNQARRHSDLKVTIMADGDGEAEIAIPSGFGFKVPKIKTNRHIIVTPAELDVLKSLNRSLNLRSAG